MSMSCTSSILYPEQPSTSSSSTGWGEGVYSSKSRKMATATPLLLFIFFFLVSFPFLSIQTAFVAPIQKDYNSGLYSISAYMKTPLRPAKLHLDLGGSFSWIDCYNHFDSSSYRHVDCQSPLCKSLDPHICGNCFEPPNPVCANDTCFLYPEQPSIRDSIDYDNQPKKLTDSENAITDNLALLTTDADGSNPGSLRLIPRLPFACVKTAFLRGLAKNVIGLAALGRGNESIPSMVSAVFKTPRCFAVCLSGSKSKPGVAFFGSKGPYKLLPNIDLSKALIYTPLLFNPASGSVYTYWLPSYEYYIGLTAIKINGQAVAFNTSLLPFEPYHGAGGTKISTSTAYALLQTSIYRVFKDVFVKESAAFKLRPVANPVKPFGVCYDANSVSVTPAGLGMPAVDLVMENGKVVWRMTGRNSMVRIKKNGMDFWCLGYVDGGVNPRTPIVIGGLQMEDQLLQFDLENLRLGFSSSALLKGIDCSNFNFTYLQQ